MCHNSEFIKFIWNWSQQWCFSANIETNQSFIPSLVRGQHRSSRNSIFSSSKIQTKRCNKLGIHIGLVPWHIFLNLQWFFNSFSHFYLSFKSNFLVNRNLQPKVEHHKNCKCFIVLYCKVIVRSFWWIRVILIFICH